MKRFALVGSPNSGKSTLFNWLTGRKQKVVNYPGSTVDIAVGSGLSIYGADIEFIDTPGTYSLYPKSQDEEITLQALFDEKWNLDGVIAVLDSTQMARQLPLVKQLKDCGFNVFIALTMFDLHTKDQSVVRADLLEKELGLPVFPIDGILGGGVKSLVSAILKSQKNSNRPVHPKVVTAKDVQNEQVRGQELADRVAKSRLSAHEWTEKLDQILLHPLMGGLIFFVVMTLLFSSIYWMAAPLMDFVDGFFADSADWVLSQFGNGLFSKFISEGVIVGMGAVFVFVPQIFILFVGISALEDSGYLARAATIVDKPLSLLGLNGKAFVPLLSGFACAVPAMMAARSMNSKKEKWLTMLVIPFMTCSARLPVYALFISFLFVHEPLKGGVLMAALYLGGIIVAAVVAGLLARIIKFERKGFFVMELPLYRQPKLKSVLKNSLFRSRAYIVKTGPVILTLSIVLWCLSTFPNYQEMDTHKRLESSYIAKVGQVIEPVFEPMGVDWRVGIGLMTAFAAREVFVSSMAVVLNVGDDGDEESLRGQLISQMRQTKFPDGRPVFTTASIASILVFFMVALQCISTSSIAWREMASARFALGQLLFMNVLAYVMSVIIHRILV